MRHLSRRRLSKEEEEKLQLYLKQMRKRLDKKFKKAFEKDPNFEKEYNHFIKGKEERK